MTGLTLRLDAARWRMHLQTVTGATPGVVPVAKGNGYGYGLRRLALEAERLGVDTIAVGTADEVAEVRDAFGGSIVILTPWRPDNDRAIELAADPRIITTVSRVADLEALTDLNSDPRVLLEVLTSMCRHGIFPDELRRVRPYLEHVRFEGWTIHLPLLDDGRYAEAERLGRSALEAAHGPLWFSHLPPEDVAAVARQLGGAGSAAVPTRLRLGTRLWLGDPSSRTTTATVIDVHRVKRGQRAGYRQRPVWADGWVLVIAGGTSAGIGMEAPTPASSFRQRAVSVATGSLAAAGRALSPYTVNGRKRWFLEPPHMQSSLIFLPAKETPPAVGEEVPVELRLTTATVDHIFES